MAQSPNGGLYRPPSILETFNRGLCHSLHVSTTNSATLLHLEANELVVGSAVGGGRPVEQEEDRPVEQCGACRPWGTWGIGGRIRCSSLQGTYCTGPTLVGFVELYTTLRDLSSVFLPNANGSKHSGWKSSCFWISLL